MVNLFTTRIHKHKMIQPQGYYFGPKATQAQQSCDEARTQLCDTLSKDSPSARL